MANIVINGFGRIGRSFFKLAITKPELNIVAINDLGDLANLAYLLKYDSAYGRFDKDGTVKDGKMLVGGKENTFLNTTHGYTATQNLVDGPVKGHDFRRGRAAGVNIVPSYTGAAIAVGRAVKAVEGKFEGTSMRVPIVTGSLSSITFVSSRPTTAEEINKILRDASAESRWNGIFRATDDQIVSSDIVGDPYAAIADLSLTKVVDGDLCCVYSWYDNEFGYTNSLVDHVLKVAATL